jgi:hypothetical protein
MGAAGPAIIFVCSMVGAVIVAAYILAFSASALLVVVEGTAGGQDEVHWPTEPWADIAGRAAYLGSLLAIWLIPAGLLWNALREVWLPEQPALRLLLIVGPGLWLYFPLGLFSSMRSVSGWAFFRFDILRDMFRVFPATLLVYFVSALFVALVGYAWLVALVTPTLLFIAAPLTSIAWLLYARLLGRLGYKIAQLKPIKVKKTKKKKPARRVRPEERATEVTDPWAVPEEVPVPQHEPEPEPEPEEPVVQKKPRSLLLDEEPEPYELSDEAPPARPNVVPLDGYDPDEVEDVAPPDPKLSPVDNANRAIADRERRLTRRKKPPKKPRMPMFEGILTFPFYPRCIRPMVNVAMGWGVFGVLIVLMLRFNPI